MVYCNCFRNKPWLKKKMLKSTVFSTEFTLYMNIVHWTNYHCYLFQISLRSIILKEHNIVYRSINIWLVWELLTEWRFHYNEKKTVCVVNRSPIDINDACIGRTSTKMIPQSNQNSNRLSGLFCVHERKFWMYKIEHDLQL